MVDATERAELQQPSPSRRDELKRSWWIVLTLVPFGWLASAGFFYAGHKAKHNRWKIWALVYFVLAWAATVVASVEELSEPWRQAGGMVMLFVAWPVPFLHALRIRRRYLDRAAPRSETFAAQDAGPTEESETPIGRRGPWLALGFVLFTVFGAIMAVTGEGADRIWGLITLLFFGVGGVAVYLPKGDEGPGVEVARGSYRGSEQWGLVFRIDQRRQRVRSIGSLGFAIAGGLMLVFAGEIGEEGTRYSPVLLRVVGGLMLAFFGPLGALAVFRWRARPRVVLLEDGVLMDQGHNVTFVPWDALEDVGVISIYGNDMLGMLVGDRGQVEANVFARLLLPLNRAISRVDMAYPVDTFVADPRLVVDAMRHYLAHPEERPRLSSGDARAVRPGGVT
ncbi:MAG: hypothetical protein M3N53_06395 [Actinomycetota bacterium]|nr:hypothetical protein [Actinomycetota bacterium]